MFATASVTVESNPPPMAATSVPIPTAWAPELSAPAVVVATSSAIGPTNEASVRMTTARIATLVPTVTPMAAVVRLRPRRSSAAAAGARVAARITAMTTGMITTGNSSATWATTANNAATTSARQLH